MWRKIDFTAKWLFDRFMAFIGLLLLWPLMLAIAVAVKVSEPHSPVIFRQKRVGQHGALFTIYKFRTMSHGSIGTTVSVLGDSRITPLGAWLRRYKLDELPELWNVLVADMSFVGPRPDVPGFADRLAGDEKIILTLKPGITGPATLKYRNEEQLLATQPDPEEYNAKVIWPDKVQINLSYLHRRTFLGDILIILETIGLKR